MLGENVKRYREQANMTQQQLADRLGVNQSLVGQIERGSRYGGPAVIIGEMAEILNVTTDDLIKGNRDSA